MSTIFTGSAIDKEAARYLHYEAVAAQAHA
jgi:hypothetical protein